MLNAQKAKDCSATHGRLYRAMPTTLKKGNRNVLSMKPEDEKVF